MKRLVLLCLTIVFVSSCSIDDASTVSIELLPVESVDIPDAFELGEIYPITVAYFRPSTCHFFKEFYYVRENNTRTVAPINYCYGNDDCEPLEDELVEVSFDFLVTSNGSYIFEFWQGKDDAGESQYLTIEVPVVEP